MHDLPKKLCCSFATLHTISSVPFESDQSIDSSIEFHPLEWSPLANFFGSYISISLFLYNSVCSSDNLV